MFTKEEAKKFSAISYSQESYTTSWSRLHTSLFGDYYGATHFDLSWIDPTSVINVVDENTRGFWWNDYKSKKLKNKRKYYHLNPACELRYCEWCSSTKRVQEVFTTGIVALCFSCRMIDRRIVKQENKIRSYQREIVKAKATISKMRKNAKNKAKEIKVQNLKPEPKTRSTQLYRHYSKDGTLLYVGVSLSAIKRLSEHNKESRWFPTISRVEIETYATREEALQKEKQTIKEETPLWNRMHNRRLDRAQ